MNYFEYSKRPSDILKVQGAHITDIDVSATVSVLVQLLYLHSNVFVVLLFLIDFFI